MSYHILISDDDIKLTRWLRRSLTKEGYSVDEANDGKDALEKWQQNNYDIIILDVMMPELGGREVVIEIKKESDDIPIIIVSGQATLEDERFLKPIVFDYLIKPVHLAVLRDKIKEALGQQS